MPSKRGRKPVEDSDALLKMARLLQENPRLSVRAAALEAARSLRGLPASHVERLRKKHAEMHRYPPRVAMQMAQESLILDYFSSTEKKIAQARADISLLEEKAEREGIDVSGDVEHELMRLNERVEILRKTIRDTNRFAQRARQRGATPADAIEEFRLLCAEANRLEERQRILSSLLAAKNLLNSL